MTNPANLISKLPPEVGDEVNDRVVAVQLGFVGEPNPGQNTAEDTPQVEELPIDKLERTAAVLLVPGAQHRGVEQSYGMLADSLVTGRFSQVDSVLVLFPETTGVAPSTVRSQAARTLLAQLISLQGNRTIKHNLPFQL